MVRAGAALWGWLIVDTADITSQFSQIGAQGMDDGSNFGDIEGTDRVRAHAAQLGLDVEIVERPEASSLDEAASLLGIAPGELVKTLVVKRHDGSFLFALVPGGRKISWAKLRAVVGVNKLSLPDKELALEATGYERGTITPLGSRTALPVYADSTIGPGRIALGAGAHGHSLFVDSAAFLAALGAQVGDITDPE